MTSETLLREITDAAKDLGIAPSTLCQRAVKHSKLPQRLEGGGSVTLETADRLRRWIKAARKRAA